MLGKRSLYFKVPRLEGRGFLSFSALVIGALIGASALSGWAQTSGTWTGPSATPPGNNIAAPINVSTAPQAKSGLLGLSNFLFNPAWTSGSVATGSILTALDSDGTVGWGTAAVSSGSSSSGGGPGTRRHAVEIGAFPVSRARRHLHEFLRFDPPPLSHRAADGFQRRLLRSSLSRRTEFEDALAEYVSQRA